MRPQLLITRPAGLAAGTAEAAARAGFRPVVAPLLEIEPLCPVLPEVLPEALLFTSPQAPAHVAGRADLRQIPAWAVGSQTARAARAAGFSVAGEGCSDGSALVAAMAAEGVRSALHLCGADVAALAVPGDFRLEQRAVYRARAAECLPDAARAALASGACSAVLLFSARTAAIFASLVDAAGLSRSPVALAAISARAAAAAGSGWRQVAVAAAPTEAALLGTAAGLAGGPSLG